MSVLLILIAWFVAMPLWLSILITIDASLRLMFYVILFFCKLFQGGAAKEAKEMYKKYSK